MKKSREILHQYWGYEDFRPLQSEIVESVLYGHDTLAILPTGGGKSICFQVPGLALEGLTIVISPLIALMEDQVINLRSRGIKAELITSSMNYREIDITLDNARFGNVPFLYTSPERLKSSLFIERCKQMNVSLIAIDEAHCISEWGHDFRPAYREIAAIRELHPDAPMIALTASATKRVQDDICNQLQLNSPNRFEGSLERNNISYKVIPSQNKLQEITNFCINNKEFTGIIYCQTRRSVKAVTEHLRAAKLSAGFYHGGLSAEDRKYMLDHWMKNSLRIMVATNAFGMGIDKPDVRYVLHYEIPNNLEAYYQEAGRAGRDGKEAQAIAYWEQKDLEKMKDQLEARYPKEDRVKTIYNSLCNHLKIAIGSGNQESYDFNIQDFHKTYNIPVSEAYYALKILELNETLNFSENAFHPTRLKFAIGSSALYKFQVAHDKVASLITILTRSYPGIFDRFIRLDEQEIIKRLKVSKKELNERLKYLEQYGVADINFQSNMPKVTFVTERLPEGYLKLSHEIYNQRKNIEQQKLDSIIEYVTAPNCRSQLISAYFDSSAEPCGKCDFCVSEQNNTYSHKELLEVIPTYLPATIDELSNATQCDKNTLKKALHALMLEEKVKFQDNVFVLA